MGDQAPSLVDHECDSRLAYADGGDRLVNPPEVDFDVDDSGALAPVGERDVHVGFGPVGTVDLAVGHLLRAQLAEALLRGQDLRGLDGVALAVDLDIRCKARDDDAAASPPIDEHQANDRVLSAHHPVGLGADLLQVCRSARLVEVAERADARDDAGDERADLLRGQRGLGAHDLAHLPHLGAIGECHLGGSREREDGAHERHHDESVLGEKTSPQIHGGMGQVGKRFG